MVSYTPGGLPGRLPYTGTRSPGTRLMHITRPEPSRPHAPAGLGVESLRASGGPPSNLPYTSQATYPIPPCRSTLHRPRPSTLYLPSRIPYTSHPTYPIPPSRPTLCRPRPHTPHLPPSSNPPSRPAYPIPPWPPTLYIPPTFLTPALPSHQPCTPPRETAPHACVPRATYPIPPQTAYTIPATFPSRPSSQSTYPIPHRGKLCACLCPPTGLPYTRHPAANSGRRPTTTIVSSL
jgi:hypothetical protein